MAKLSLPISFVSCIPLTTFEQGGLSDAELLLYYEYNILTFGQTCIALFTQTNMFCANSSRLAGNISIAV